MLHTIHVLLVVLPAAAVSFPAVREPYFRRAAASTGTPCLPLTALAAAAAAACLAACLVACLGACFGSRGEVGKTSPAAAAAVAAAVVATVD